MDSTRSTETQIEALRTEMREGFVRQEGRVVEMREGFVRQEERVVEMRESFMRTTTELGRDIARQDASFDQAMAGMHEDHVRSRRAQSTIWAMLIERTAEIDNDVGDLKEEAHELKHRVERLEQRTAG